MRSWSVLLLTAALQVAQTERELAIHKCCSAFQMLSGNGSTCVNGTWPRNRTLQDGAGRNYEDLPFVLVQPADAPWVGRWLPPGVPFHRIRRVYFRYLNNLKRLHLHLPMWTVDESVEWDERQAEITGSTYFSRRVIFLNAIYDKRAFGPQPRPMHNTKLFDLAGYRPTKYCVDAAQPPLGPFALVAEPDCDFDACVRKCCKPWELVGAEKGGSWACRIDSRADKWSRHSFFAPLLPSNDAVYHYKSFTHRDTCLRRHSPTARPLRLSLEDELAVHLLQRRYHDYMWSTWETCVDFELLKNGTLRDTIFYCPQSRITRGVYLLLRHLSFVSVSLLVVALSSVACNSRMRLKAHGWCLACHASCLLGVNLGQAAYYMTISDQIDAFGFVPLHLRNTCRTFALPMYFLLMAAKCWLTALCFNMAWGFRKLQMVRPTSGKDWRRFLIFSAFAWGLPALMTGLCAYLYEKDDAKRRWFSPSLAETRTCFNEMVISHGKEDYLSSYQSGTALFYYGPVCILFITNLICIGCTLRKVQFLRRGNSVLHREQDKVAQTPRKADGESARGGNARTSNAARSTVADAKTIRLYVKMLLITGVIDVIAEIIGWASIPTHWSVLNTKLYEYFREDDLFFRDHLIGYRVTGYATDCFRAACIVWLAAPEGGYFGALRGWLGSHERDRGDGRGLAGRP